MFSAEIDFVILEKRIFFFSLFIINLYGTSFAENSNIPLVKCAAMLLFRKISKAKVNKNKFNRTDRCLVIATNNILKQQNHTPLST